MSLRVEPAPPASPVAVPAARASIADVVAAAEGLVPALVAEAAEVDREDAFPVASIAALRDARILAAAAPGPASLLERRQLPALLGVLAHLGRGSLPVGRLYEGHVNALLLIDRYGDDAQRGRARRAALAGQLFAVWNTEAADGVRLARAADGGSALSGSKTFASGAGRVDHAIVTARDADAGGWQMTWFDAKRNAATIERRFWRPLGMRATGSFRITFDGVRLGEDERIGPPDAYYREPLFSGGAIRFAAVQAGGIEAIFDATREQLRGERRTGDPHQQARLGRLAVVTASARQWLQAAASVARDATDDATVVAHANLMRSAVEALGLEALQLAERCVGARGLLHPAPFERLHRDLTHYLRQANPDAALTAVGAHVMAAERPAPDLWTA